VAQRRSISLFLGVVMALGAVLVASSAAAAVSTLPSASPSVVVTAVPTVDPCATVFLEARPAAPAATPSCTPPCVILSVDAVPLPTPCATPFESFQGETAQPSATPPPTSTAGNSSGDGSLPLPILALSVMFGALGLMAVTQQRRKIRL
jgi:hypothetical protein